jgi:hypothetical protein
MKYKAIADVPFAEDVSRRLVVRLGQPARLAELALDDLRRQDQVDRQDAAILIRRLNPGNFIR